MQSGLHSISRKFFGWFKNSPSTVSSQAQGSKILEGLTTQSHTDLLPAETAVVNLLPRQKSVLIILLGSLGLLLLLNWHVTLVLLVSVITIVYFADILYSVFLVFRSFWRPVAVDVSREETLTVSEQEWPSYTILCPLYKEWEVIPQFVEAIDRLEYPSGKLQVLLLLEADDHKTIAEVQRIDLPAYFEIVIVPHSLPKTKPKAMNYALQFVSGQFTVIYDAEDIPDPDQLKKAVVAFRKAPPQVICIQAKLNFYNSEQNLLTKMFTAEYSLWFDLVLPGLQSVNAPIPLGGTSNHFKTPYLKKLKGWDPFNVTEDCDLGIRLAKRGYQTALLNSTTWEEANSQIRNWYNQRSRWLKGYMQTYLVHMRQWRLFMRYRKPKDFAVFQLVVGGKVASTFINPFMWLMTIIYFVFRSTAGNFIESLFPTPIFYMGVFSFLFGNFFYMYNYMIGCAKRGFFGLIKYIFLVPVYWLGISAAAWKGLIEIIIRPHYWAKTKHGLHLKTEQSATAISGFPVINNKVILE